MKVLRTLCCTGLAFTFPLLPLLADATSFPTPEETLLLWPDTPALSSLEGKGKQVVKREKAFLVGVATPHLQVLAAPESNTPTPAILLVPGGGYSQLAVGIHTEIAAWFQQ